MNMTKKPWVRLKAAIVGLIALTFSETAVAGEAEILAANYAVGGVIDLATTGYEAAYDRGPIPDEVGVGVRTLSREELGQERAVGVDGVPMVQTGGEVGDLAVILWDEFLGSQLGQSNGRSAGYGSVTVNGHAH